MSRLPRLRASGQEGVPEDEDEHPSQGRAGAGSQDGRAGEGVAEQALYEHTRAGEGGPGQQGVCDSPRTQPQQRAPQRIVGEVSLTDDKRERDGDTEREDQDDPGGLQAAH